MIDFADEIGLVGVILILVSYSLLQMGKVKGNSISYSVINLIGAVLILFSLFYNWNLASVIIEIFWILISLMGIGKHFWEKGKKGRHKKEITDVDTHRFTPIR